MRDLALLLLLSFSKVEAQVPKLTSLQLQRFGKLSDKNLSVGRIVKTFWYDTGKIQRQTVYEIADSVAILCDFTYEYDKNDSLIKSTEYSEVPNEDFKISVEKRHIYRKGKKIPDYKKRAHHRQHFLCLST